MPHSSERQYVTLIVFHPKTGAKTGAAAALFPGSAQQVPRRLAAEVPPPVGRPRWVWPDGVAHQATSLFFRVDQRDCLLDHLLEKGLVGSADKLGTPLPPVHVFDLIGKDDPGDLD